MGPANYRNVIGLEEGGRDAHIDSYPELQWGKVK